MRCRHASMLVLKACQQGKRESESSSLTGLRDLWTRPKENFGKDRARAGLRLMTCGFFLITGRRRGNARKPPPPSDKKGCLTAMMESPRCGGTTGSWRQSRTRLPSITWTSSTQPFFPRSGAPSHPHRPGCTECSRHQKGPNPDPTCSTQCTLSVMGFTAVGGRWRARFSPGWSGTVAGKRWGPPHGGMVGGAGRVG